MFTGRGADCEAERYGRPGCSWLIMAGGRRGLLGAAVDAYEAVGTAGAAGAALLGLLCAAAVVVCRAMLARASMMFAGTVCGAIWPVCEAAPIRGGLPGGVVDRSAGKQVVRIKAGSGGAGREVDRSEADEATVVATARLPRGW